MKKIDNKHFIWAEKYRPQVVDDVIMPEKERNKIKDMIEKGRTSHLLLTSVAPGLGKTSLTHAIINDLDGDVKWINGSQERGIDTFKSTIKEFVTSVSIDDSPKVVVVDEADGLTIDAQKIARGIIEEYSKNATFILTANYKEKIIEPLRNRFTSIDFDNLYNKNKDYYGKAIFERLQYILENEEVQYDKKDLQPILVNLFPSFRKMVITLQQSVEDGELIVNENLINQSTQFSRIMGFTKEKKFIDLRKLIHDLDDPGALYTYVYKNLDNLFKPESQPRVILICAKYQDMSERARDKNITAAAFCVELMSTPGIDFI